MRRVPPEPERIEILRALIARKCFNGIWLAGTRLSVRYELYEEPRPMRWSAARSLTLKKPPAKAQSSEELRSGVR